MDELDTVLPGPPSEEFELGEMIGLRRAFGSVAGRCSAASVASIKSMRDRKLYKSRAENWEQFCLKHLGMTSSHANRLIRYLDEFGPEFYQLAQLTRISPREYRALRAAVKDGALVRDGDAIALIPENAERVTRAISAWREEAKTIDVPKWKHPADALPSLEKRAKRLAQEFSQILGARPSHDQRARVSAALERVRRAFWDVK